MANTQLQHNDAIIASMIGTNSLSKDGSINRRIIQYPYTDEDVQYISRENDPSSYRMWGIVVKSIELESFIPHISEIRESAESSNSSSNFEVVLEIKDQTDLALQRICEELRFMAENKYDWETEGIEDAENPSILSFDNMRTILENIIKKSSNQDQYFWIPPFLTDDPDGTLCAEWYYQDRSLHFDIKDNLMEYMKIGKSVNPENKHGILNTNNSFSLWTWLIDG